MLDLHPHVLKRQLSENRGSVPKASAPVALHGSMWRCDLSPSSSLLTLDYVWWCEGLLLCSHTLLIARPAQLLYRQPRFH